MNTKLAEHIISMADDSYLTGHPEWKELVKEAKENKIANEMQNDINVAWNELEEVTANYDQLSTEEVIELLPIIMQRVRDAMNWIGKYAIDIEELLPITESEAMRCYEEAVSEQNCNVSFEQFKEDNGYNFAG